MLSPEDKDDVHCSTLPDNIEADVRRVVNRLIANVSLQANGTTARLFDESAFRDISDDETWSATESSSMCSDAESLFFSDVSTDDSECLMNQIERKAVVAKPDTKALPPTVRGELRLEDLPPIEKLCISLNEDISMRPAGTIYSTVDKLVILKAVPDAPPLNDGTVLFDETRKPVGEIFETFGAVKAPYYSIRFNSSDEIQALNFLPNQQLFYAASSALTHHVFVADLLKEKGSDASWTNDLEPPPEALDFSDDEEQRLHQQKLRAKRKMDDRNASGSDVPQRNQRMPNSNLNVATMAQMYYANQRTYLTPHANQISPTQNYGGGQMAWSSPTEPTQQQQQSGYFSPQSYQTSPYYHQQQWPQNPFYRR